MSAEALLFLAIFFLLPLIERILERNRQQRERPLPPEREDPIDPMQDRQGRPAPPPSSRPVPPPPPVPVETRVPDRNEGEAPRPQMPAPRPTPAPAPRPGQPRRPTAPPPPPPMDGRPTPGRRPPVASRPTAPKPAPKPSPHTRPVEPAVAMPAEVLKAIRARERAQAERAARSALVAQAARPHARRSVVRILRNPRSLRQAMVVAAVLGPCKAMERE